MKYIDVTRQLEKLNNKKVKTIDQIDARIRVINHLQCVHYNFLAEPEASQQYDKYVQQYTKQLVSQWEAEFKNITKHKNTSIISSYALEIAQSKHDYGY